MPQYEYKCNKCNKEITELRPMVDRDVEKPCSCGGTLKKQFSLATVHSFNVPNPRN